MKSLVTGGAGFIGSHLVDRLLDDEGEVIVLDNFIAGKDENLSQHKGNKHLKIIRGSVTEDLTPVFESGKIDVVFHLAALPRLQFSIDHPIEAHNVNINGTLNLLQACRNYGIGRLVFSSSSSVYGDQPKQPLIETLPPNGWIVPYALQKLTGEYYCRLYYQLFGVEAIILRYFSVYGPRQNPFSAYSQVIAASLVKEIKADKNDPPFITGDGEQTRNFTYISDVVEANILAAKTSNKNCHGQIFNIGSEQPISINRVMEKIIAVTRGKIKPVRHPSRVEAKDIIASSKKAQKLLGWRAKVSFDEGIEKTFEYFWKEVDRVI